MKRVVVMIQCSPFMLLILRKMLWVNLYEENLDYGNRIETTINLYRRQGPTTSRNLNSMVETRMVNFMGKTEKIRLNSWAS